MDIKEKKNLRNIDPFIIEFIKNLEFKNNKVLILGTASQQAQYYFSDYDLYTNINEYDDIKIIKKEINRILTLKNPNIYFIEFKTQLLNGDKIKKNKLPIKWDKINRDDIDYIKLDYVIYSNYEFIDVSIIYNLNKKDKTKEEVIKLINKDKNEFIKDKNYFKALKRIFSIYNLEDNKKEMVKLTNFFNSKYGKEYKIVSNLKTIKMIKEKYKNNKIIDTKIKYNLQKLGINNINNKGIDELIKSKSENYNNEAKKYLDKIKI